MRRGQITLFLVIGIGLIFFLGVIYVLTEKIENQDTDDSYKVVQEYAETCLSQVTDQAVFEVAWNGGFMQGNEFYGESSPSSAIEWEGRTIPLVDSAADLAKKEDIERRIEKIALVKFYDCLDLEAFDGQGFTVTGPKVSFEEGYQAYDFVTADVNMDRDSIVITLTYPIKITQGKKVIRYETFTHKSRIRLQRVMEALSDQSFGLFRSMENAWLDPLYPYDTAFYLEDYDCDPADPYHFITLRFIEGDEHMIIRVIDYFNFYVTNHERGLVFQIAWEKDSRRQMRGLICKGTEASI
jgi:hypothetical protein